MRSLGAVCVAVAILFLLWPERLAKTAPGAAFELIVWNVGQGQWVTFSTPSACAHFDMGGEKADWREIQGACGGKRNFALFSHWDWDHVAFARTAAQRLPRFCIARMPGGEAPPRRAALFSRLPQCALENRDPETEALIAEVTGEVPYTPRRKRGRPDSNAASRVFVVSRSVLLPGDSPAAAEKTWSARLPGGHMRALVLGHHGSRTSTSQALLRRLPNLRLAIASARSRRYGHPHADVRRKLRARAVALLTTEAWGHIHVALVPPTTANARPKAKSRTQMP